MIDKNNFMILIDGCKDVIYFSEFAYEIIDFLTNINI